MGEVKGMIGDIVYINTLEKLRKELGFKTKRAFAEWLEVPETDYSRWSKQKIQPSMPQFIFLRNQIRRKKPEIIIDDLIFEVT